MDNYKEIQDDIESRFKRHYDNVVVNWEDCVIFDDSYIISVEIDMAKNDTVINSHSIKEEIHKAFEVFNHNVKTRCIGFTAFHKNLIIANYEVTNGTN